MSSAIVWGPPLARSPLARTPLLLFSISDLDEEDDAFLSASKNRKDSLTSGHFICFLKEKPEKSRKQGIFIGSWSRGIPEKVVQTLHTTSTKNKGD